MCVYFHFCIKIWTAAGGFAEVLGAGWAEEGAKPQPPAQPGAGGSRASPLSGGGASLDPGRDIQGFISAMQKGTKG